MVIGPVGERLQAGTENATVLERLAPLRRLHDSSAGYKYPDLLIFTYLRWLSRVCTVVQYAVLQTPEYMENGKFDPPPPRNYKMAKDIQTPPRIYDYVAELICSRKSEQNRLTQFSWGGGGGYGNRFLSRVSTLTCDIIYIFIRSEEQHRRKQTIKKQQQTTLV